MADFSASIPLSIAACAAFFGCPSLTSNSTQTGIANLLIHFSMGRGKFGRDRVPKLASQLSRLAPGVLYTNNGTDNPPAVLGSLSVLGTPEFERSSNERKKVEMRFAHLKVHHAFERMRLRGLTGARDEFHLGAIVQNFKTLANHRRGAIPSKPIARMA